MENRNKNISFSVPCKLMLKNIETASLLSRNTYLCTVHQYIAFKLKYRKRFRVDITLNPEIVKKTVSFDYMKA